MKVVHVVHCFPPEFRGGTEVCVQRLAAAQLARGDQPVILAGSPTTRDDPTPALEQQDGLPVLRVWRRPDEQYSVDFRLPRVADQVVQLVAEQAPDLVHLHHGLHLSGDLAARLDRAGLPVLATLHDFTLVCARFFLVRPDGESCAQAFPLPSDRCQACVLPDFAAGAEALRRELQARAATARAEAAALRCALCPSETARRRWLASGLFEPAALVTLPHGLPLADHKRLPPRDRSDGRLVLATWGHLAPAKGLADLLQALRHVGDPRLELRVLGEAVDEAHGAELRRAAEGLPVRFEGAFGPADLAALRGGADLAVFPSRAEETFGLVAAEARVLGFGVVVSDRGALPEMVGDGGAVVPAADPAALAALLARLLEQPGLLEAWSRAPAPALTGSAGHAERVADVYARALESPA